MKFKKEFWIFFALFLLFFLGFLGRFYIVGYGIGAGGNSYYPQMVSLILDGDVDTRDEFEDLPSYQDIGNPLHYNKRLHPPPYCPLNHQLTAYPIGPGLFWSPFFIVGHLLTLVLGVLGFSVVLNGFGNIDQIFSMFGSILFGVVGLYLAYRFSNKFYSSSVSLISLLAIVFGFSVVQYISIEPSVAHALTIFTVSLFLYYFYLTREDNSFRKWIVLGVLGGLMMLTKWQEGFFFFLPLFYFCRDFFKGDVSVKKDLFLKGLLFLLVVFIVFFPQLMVWDFYHGGYFSFPEDGKNLFDFFDPLENIPYFLFSFHHSLLVTTPIILLSLIGGYFFYKKEKFFGLALILQTLLLIYVNSSLTGAGGTSFGARRMIDFTLIFVLFLAALLSWVKGLGSRWYYLLLIIIGLLVAFNLLYFLEYNLNLIDRVAPVSYGEILSKAGGIFKSLMRYV